MTTYANHKNTQSLALHNDTSAKHVLTIQTHVCTTHTLVTCQKANLPSRVPQNQKWSIKCSGLFHMAGSRQSQPPNMLEIFIQTCVSGMDDLSHAPCK